MSDTDDDGGDAIDDSLDGVETPEEFVKIYDSIETYFLPATNGTVKPDDWSVPLSTGFESIEDIIDGKRGDPDKLYPLHERVKILVGALQSRISALKSKGYR